MSKTSANARSYGEGTIYVAPTGSTAPTDATTAPAVAFLELGWLDPDEGMTEGRQLTTTIKRGWNGGAIIRTLKSNQGYTFKVRCLEENAIVLGLLYPGSTGTTTSGKNHIPVVAFTGQDLRSFIIDMLDGSIHKRKYIAVGEITGFGDVVYKEDDLTFYDFTITAYANSSGLFFDEFNDDTADAFS
jgi:hypothetical protein